METKMQTSKFVCSAFGNLEDEAVQYLIREFKNKIVRAYTSANITIDMSEVMRIPDSVQSAFAGILDLDDRTMFAFVSKHHMYQPFAKLSFDNKCFAIRLVLSMLPQSPWFSGFPGGTLLTAEEINMCADVYKRAMFRCLDNVKTEDDLAHFLGTSLWCQSVDVNIGRDIMNVSRDYQQWCPLPYYQSSLGCYVMTVWNDTLNCRVALEYVKDHLINIADVLNHVTLPNDVVDQIVYKALCTAVVS